MEVYERISYIRNRRPFRPIDIGNWRRRIPRRRSAGSEQLRAAEKHSKLHN